MFDKSVQLYEFALSKAIELSLKESQSPKQSALHGTSSSGPSSSLYPSVHMGQTSAPSPATYSAPQPATSEPKRVRALYDFEAVEDNELTFFTGELIVVLDDSDVNWWKGSNQRGEGLFPANFVTTDLSEPTRTETKKGVQFNETVQVKSFKAPDHVDIDEGKIDRVLHLLHEADPNDGRNDTEEMLTLEDEVYKMSPLIDTELEKIDRKHAELSVLSASLVEALNMYHGLMHEAPGFPGGAKMLGVGAMPPPPHMYGPGPSQPPSHLPPQMYNGNVGVRYSGPGEFMHGPPPGPQGPPPPMVSMVPPQGHFSPPPHLSHNGVYGGPPGNPGHQMPPPPPQQPSGPQFPPQQPPTA